MDGKGESTLLLSVGKLSSDQYVGHMFKGSESLVNLLAKAIVLHWLRLRRPLRLPLAFIVVTFLWGCSVPSLALCFLQQQRLNKFLVLFWISVLLCLSHSSLCTWFSFFYYLSLWSMFLCSLFSSLSKPYLGICFLACLASSSSPSIGKKPRRCLCRAPGYTFTGPKAFLFNSSYCTSSIGGKGSAK